MGIDLADITAFDGSIDFNNRADGVDWHGRSPGRLKRVRQILPIARCAPPSITPDLADGSPASPRTTGLGWCAGIVSCLQPGVIRRGRSEQAMNAPPQSHARDDSSISQRTGGSMRICQVLRHEGGGEWCRAVPASDLSLPAPCGYH